MTSLKILAVLAVATLATGCKLAVMVPSGGDVTSASGTRNCTGGSLCEHNITDLTFNESFKAVARPGYVFTKWNKGTGFYCGDSTNPTCTISNVGAGVIAGIGTYVAGGSFSYAMPLFEFVGIDTDGDGSKDHLDEDDDNDGVLDGDDDCPLDPSTECSLGVPITDTVRINGKEWAQVDLFDGLSWNDINAACPTGTCNGVLKGYSMVGWTWASVGDVNELFNHYIGSPYFGPEPQELWESGSIWAPLIFLDGMRSMDGTNFRRLKGRIRGTIPGDALSSWVSGVHDDFPQTNYDVIIWDAELKTWANWDIGGWFYRVP